MANIYGKVFKPRVIVVSVQDFRKNYADNISSQAIKYAIKNDMLDYVKIDHRINLIVINKKTIKYAKRTNKNIK